MTEQLISQSIALPSGELRILQPESGAELPDDHAVEWAPLAPYWSIVWRAGVALACELDRMSLRGLRVVELGCGLGLPSLAAARAGAEVLATDMEPEALRLLARNAHANGVEIETARVDWADPGALLSRGPFDLAVGSDIIYERDGIDRLESLLPQLAPEAWIAEPGRDAAEAFLKEANRRWSVTTREEGVVRIHRLRMDQIADRGRNPRGAKTNL